MSCAEYLAPPAAGEKMFLYLLECAAHTCGRCALRQWRAQSHSNITRDYFITPHSTVQTRQHLRKLSVSSLASHDVVLPQHLSLKLTISGLVLVVREVTSMAKHHISWGGLSVHHLCLDDSVLEIPRYCDRTTGNSKLHRFAQSDDCLHARKIIDGKDVNDIWNLVSKTSLEVSAK